MIKKINNKKGGFTIIELMISIALFIIVVMTGIGALLNASFIHHRAQSMRGIMDNLNFVMEDMSRNLRTGYHYHCLATLDALPILDGTVNTPLSCSDGQGIIFETSKGSTTDDTDQWAYYISPAPNRKIYKSTQGASDITKFIQISPDEVDIDTGSGFSVLGAEAPDSNGGGDNQQPLVLIRLSGKVIDQRGGNIPFSLETTVSQRLIDIAQ